eukprot:GEMP01035108.1.p1 GENE.GEMP01035108.1~~GEMP01035108.1.p1  ORF type:complete len:357 (+),score=69.75 GEMP01035108.1:149-1219(+)
MVFIFLFFSSFCANATTCAAKMGHPSPKRIRVEKFGGPDVLEVQSFELPQLKEGEVLVEVRAFGINPVETYIRAGTYQLPVPAEEYLPFTPGKDSAGVIVESRSTGFQNGDRVYTVMSETGVYATHAIAKGTDVRHLPDNLSFEQGCALGIPYRTAYRALLKANAKPGQSILVHGGSGAVGRATVELARYFGLGPIVATRGNNAVDIPGADFILNHRESDYFKALASSGLHLPTRPITKGPCFDIIIEMLADVNLQTDILHLQVGGTIVVIGNRGSTEINARNLMQVEGTITGFIGLGTPEDEKRVDLGLATALKAGAITPSVGPIFTMENVGKAHEEVLSHSLGTTGKVVVVTGC